jgi:hypothetical protein
VGPRSLKASTQLPGLARIIGPWIAHGFGVRFGCLGLFETRFTGRFAPVQHVYCGPTCVNVSGEP